MPIYQPQERATRSAADDLELCTGPSFDDYPTLAQALAAESALYATLLQEWDAPESPPIPETSGGQ